MKNIAIIPARSGSKGIKDKNIKPFNGKPLMAYTIEAARRSGMFDTVIVSTDSEIYANIARQYGGNVPFLRNRLLATDSASSWDVVMEVLDKLEERYDTFALLQPTSPLRTSQDITQAYKYMEDKKADFVIGVCEVEHSPLWCNTLPLDGSLEHFLSEDSDIPRQGLEQYYRINGALYVARISEFRNNKNIYRKGSYAFIMDRYKSIDIDTALDFRIAEIIAKEVMWKSEKTFNTNTDQEYRNKFDWGSLLGGGGNRLIFQMQDAPLMRCPA